METSCDSAIGPTIATLMLICLARLARQLAQAEAGVRDQAFDHHLSTGSGSGQPVAFGNGSSPTPASSDQVHPRWLRRVR